MELTQKTPEVIVCKWNPATQDETLKLVLMSDLHFDNPKADRELLKKWLKRAREEGAKVMINGDFFCLMQGKYDPRGSKTDILPQHMGPNYLNLVVDEAVEWWTPYADLLLFVGYGNHETAILKRQEIDVLKMFASQLNAKAGTNILTGAYEGWVLIQGELQGKFKSYKMKYHHGFGGGGPATKGVIQNHRLDSYVDGADCIWMGHVHELYHLVVTKEELNTQGGNCRVNIRYIDHVRTSTIKDEGGAFGFHTEKGRPRKPLGCMLLELEMSRVGNGIDLIRSFTIWR